MRKVYKFAFSPNSFNLRKPVNTNLGSIMKSQKTVLTDKRIQFYGQEKLQIDFYILSVFSIYHIVTVDKLKHC